MAKAKAKIDKEEFPYDGFPVKIVHKDGKDLKDKKTCYFDSEYNAQKYIARSKFKKKDYTMTIKGEEK
jgi:hypothetical protein